MSGILSRRVKQAAAGGQTSRVEFDHYLMLEGDESGHLLIEGDTGLALGLEGDAAVEATNITRRISL
jgi:hypothetical protein